MTVVDPLHQLQEATRSFTSNITERRGAITAKRGALEHARSGPLPLAEAIARFDAWVNETAAAQVREQGPSLVLHKFGAPLGHSSAGSPWMPSAPLTWGLACLFLGPQLKSKFAELARTIEYTPGPPQAERAAGVEQLEAELAELERAEEQLVDEATAAGVKLEHRPEVTQRRAREREQQERTARAADAERREAERAAESGDWPRPRQVVHSPYIHGSRG